MFQYGRRRAGSLSIVACVVFGVLQAAVATAEGLTEPLPPQPLADALETFSDQTGLQVVYSAALTRGIRTLGADAGRPAKQTLLELLRGTGLAFEFVNDRTVTIIEAPVSAPQQQTRRDTSADSETTEPLQPQSQRRAELEEIVVTGSNIRGAENRTVPVIAYNREDIERTGYSTVQQFIESIPQNFGGDPGGLSEDGLVGAGSARMTNTEAASAVNLRGLGVGSTLVLINGRRVAPSANASAVDVSIIPMAAVERIEVLTDGSSAIYGSEAVAGVVNIILRTDYEGAETSVGVGAVTDGDLREQTVSQMLGTQWNSGNVLLGLQYQRRDALRADERDFTSRVPTPTGLMPERKQTNVLLNVSQQLPAGFDVFGQALYSRLDTERTFTQLNGGSLQSLRSLNEGENRNFSLGVGYRPGADWRVELGGLYARQFSDFVGQATPVGVFGPVDFTRDFELNSVELKADGQLFELPGGMVRLAIGGAHREETYDVMPINRRIARDVSSAYAELSVPLIGQAQGVPLIHDLQLSAAIRYDDYSDFGETDNPRIGIVWSPMRGLDVRAAYSTSFRAPNASELELASRADSRQVMPYPLYSPSGSGTVPALLMTGGTDLQPEESRSWTYGLTYQPLQLEGLTLTFNFYDIEHTNRIATPPFALNVLQRPEVYGSLIQTYDNDAQVQAEVDAFLAGGGIYRDFFGLGLAGIRYGYNYRLQNFAAVSQRGFDIGADYRFKMGEHGFQAALYAASIEEILTSFGVGTRATDLVNTVANPLHWRGRASLGWMHGIWSANAIVNYTNAYYDQTVTPRVPVDDWLTFDINVRLTLDDAARVAWLRGTSIALSVVNAFDEDPPGIVGNGMYPSGYDVANATPLGRFVTLSVRKAW